jgi:hypothetical protein
MKKREGSMLGRARILLTIATCALATSAAAQAPAPTTAFDGTYVGVSRTLEGYGSPDPAAYRGSQTRADREGVAGDLYQKARNNCTPNGQPGLLTIAGGVPRYNGSNLYQTTWEGSVNAQGVLVMHAPLGGQLEAQIDGRGAVTGRITGGGCSYHMVWQKEGR